MDQVPFAEHGDELPDIGVKVGNIAESLHHMCEQLGLSRRTVECFPDLTSGRIDLVICARFDVEQYAATCNGAKDYVGVPAENRFMSHELKGSVVFPNVSQLRCDPSPTIVFTRDFLVFLMCRLG